MLQNAANGNIFLFSLDFIYFDYIHVCIYVYIRRARSPYLSLKSSCTWATADGYYNNVIYAII
jgi:hypothetical protein